MAKKRKPKGTKPKTKGQQDSSEARENRGAGEQDDEASYWL